MQIRVASGHESSGILERIIFQLSVESIQALYNEPDHGSQMDTVIEPPAAHPFPC